MRADMHVHTTASDGVYTPSEIVEMAKKIGLGAIAITDHDTIAGIPEAMDAARRIGIDIVPGVEISSQLNGLDIHILGYYIDIHDRTLADRLRQLREAREERNRRMIQKLNKLGIQITLEEVWNTVKKEPGQDIVLGRPHIAEALVSKGEADSIADAFKRYLAAGAKAYVQPERIVPKEAVRWIHEAGGSAVIAHPGLYRRDDLVKLIIAGGIDGIEAYHADHSPEEERHYAQMAEDAKLIVTAGSDFHGERMGEMRHLALGAKTMDISMLAKLKRRGSHIDT